MFTVNLQYHYYCNNPKLRQLLRIFSCLFCELMKCVEVMFARPNIFFTSAFWPVDKNTVSVEPDAKRNWKHHFSFISAPQLFYCSLKTLTGRPTGCHFYSHCVFVWLLSLETLSNCVWYRNRPDSEFLLHSMKQVTEFTIMVY